MKKYFLLLFCLFPLISFAAPTHQQLFDHYFALSNALARDAVPEAQKAAKELAKTADFLLETSAQKQDAVTVKELPRDEKETIRQNIASVSRLAKVILDVKKLDQMRKPFEELTAFMAGLQKDTKIQADEYYCPMVKKAWLQRKDSKEVLNPYMGKEMINCGEKKQTAKK